MPKKKAPKNAFYFFMLDYRQRCERNGERFENGLRDVQELAGPEWDSMSPELKKPYEMKAKAEKESAKGDSQRKETCCHNTFRSIDQKKEEEELEKEKMHSYFAHKFNALSSRKSNLQEHTWYVIHVNYFCITEGQMHHPAEVAIAAFSLERGVIDVYHAIVEASIPLGYRHDALQRSEGYHKIAIENNNGDRIYEIKNAVKNFLKMERFKTSHGETYKYPPLYTMEDNVTQNLSMSAAISFIKSLSMSDAEDDSDLNDIVIYPIDKLFMEIKEASSSLAYGNPFPTKTVALLELEKDLYKWTPDIACLFHQDNDNVAFCSKSYVQRWIYTICDHCCSDLDITLIKGTHLPSNSDLNFKRSRVTADKEEAVGQKKAGPVKSFSMIDHSQLNQPQSSHVYSYDQTPLRRPEGRVNPALLADRPEIDQSELNFPAIPVGNRGRGRNTRGGSRGNNPPSFADATKKK